MLPLPLSPSDLKLITFISEKAEAKKKLFIPGLSEDYIKSKGLTIGVEHVQNRIYDIRKQGLYALHGFDSETRVKLLYSLGGLIDPELLKELKRDADVILDDQQRIKYYYNKKAKLELGDQFGMGQTVHFSRNNRNQQMDNDLLAFLMERSKKAQNFMIGLQLVREFNTYILEQASG